MKLLAALLLALACWAGAYSQARTAEQIVSVPFSSLNSGNPPNGSVRHVTNGVPGTSPCQGGGSGAMASRINGVWHCPALSPGAGTGDVVGPASSSTGEIAIYSNNTGRNLGRSNSLTGIASLNAGVISVLASTGTGDVVRGTSPTITGLNASTVFGSGTIPPARIISNALTPNKCLRLSSGGAIETAAEDCGSGGGGSPGGVSGNLTYNEAGSFGGLANSSYNSTTGALTFSQLANGNDTLVGLRATDSTPTGMFLRFRDAANATDLFSVGVDGGVLTAAPVTLKTVAAPATPSSGNTTLYADTTDKNLKVKDDAGQVTLTVRATACSGTDKISSISSAGVVTCSADQTSPGGTGITTLNTLTAADQTFADVDDTNVTLSIASATSTHTFTLGWSGTLAKGRQHAATAYLDAGNTWSTGAQSFAAASSLTVPIAAGAAPTASGTVAYDSTATTLEYGENGTNRTVANTAGAQTLSSKTLDNSTVYAARDTLFTLQDDSDATKTANFDLSVITTGTNRTVTIVDAASMTVRPTTATANQWVTHIDSTGVQQKAQPAFSNLSGSLAVTQGSTGQTAVAQGDLLYGDATNSWTRLAKSTSATRYLANTGASNSPQWDQVNLANGVTGTLSDANLSANVSLLGSAIDLSGAEATGVLAAGRFPALTGDVTTVAGSLATTIANDAVTNAKLANVAASTFKGRVTASTGDPEDMTATQATSLLNTFTTTLKGLVPAPGSVTNKFLRDDGTWVVPAGAGDMLLASTQTNTGAKTFTDGTLLLNGGDYGASDESLPGSPVEKAFYLNTNASSRRLFIYNNSAYRALFQAGVDAVNLASANVTGTLPFSNGGFGITSGTSGGVPYFSSSSTVASSAALTANLPVIGGGAGAAPTVGTRSGNTTAFVTTTGTLTSGRCAEWDASGNLIQAAAACGSGGGTISSGATNTIPKYTGSTTIDDSLLSDDGTTLTYTGSGGLSLTGGSGAGYIELLEGSAPTVVANRLTFAAPADVPSTGLLYILPSDTPSNGEQLTASISGTTVTLSWDTAGSGGANTTLSNLGTTAINTSLNSDTDLTDDLGTTSIRWRDLWAGGVSVSGKSFTTEPDLSIGIFAGAITLAKNDSNTRTFYGGLFKPILNTGGSNANTTFNVLAVDTTNTATTGVTTNLLNLAYGGATKLTVSSTGAVTAGTYNGLTVTASTGTLTIANGKTATVNNSLTFSGTDSTVMTFPSTSATIARTDAANTFTGTQTFGAVVGTTWNGNTWATGTGTLSIGAGKTLAASNSLTFAGTDGTTQTFQASDTIVGRATTDTLTNKTIDVEATGNVFLSTHKTWLPFAGCNNATASHMWDVPTSNAPTAECVTGTNTQKGVVSFPDSDGDVNLQNSILLPSDWTGTVDARIRWYSTTATSGDVVWQLQTVCVADAETDDPSWNTASTVTDTAKGTTSQMNDATITGVTITGCAASEMMHVRVLRNRTHASDTITGAVKAVGLELTLRSSK